MKKSIAAALTITAAVAGGPILWAQLPLPGPPVDPAAQFEAASIKSADPASPGSRMMMMPGRVEADNVPVRLLMRPALRVQDYQILGLPDWVSNDRYTIVAKAPDGSPQNAMHRARAGWAEIDKHRLAVRDYCPQASRLVLR